MGNVLVTVSDKHSGVDTSSDGEYDYYQADVVSASDYYPFGMQMVGRTLETSKYRYGFNGQEKSDELTGNGNSYTAEFWQYDARIGRRWNRDPVYKHTPYECFAGNPLYFSDYFGLDTIRFNRTLTIHMPKQGSFSGGSMKPSANTTFSITTQPSDEKKDVFIYTNTVTIIKGDNETQTTTTTILDPESNKASGVTKGTALYFDGLITGERNNKDWESVGKLMGLDKGFYDYMVARNPNAADWHARATATEVMEELMPMLVQGGVGGYLGFSLISRVNSKTKVPWEKVSGIMRDVRKGKGNFGIGSASVEEANMAGRAWVGKGYEIASDGKTMISADGLRQYRPPSFKPKIGMTQANFEWRNVNKGQWQGNGHLDIIE